jgi:NAD(P)-dependent dehydrogenase (short-subunit alcohol dehydrogenase family)
MDLGLHGKIAIVTGGSGGIGSAIAKTLVREGTSTVVTYFKNAEKAEEIVKDIEKAGGTGIALQVDVRDAALVQRLFEQTDVQLGGLDILVNCAGSANFHPLKDYNETYWDTDIDTNLKGTFLCCRAALPFFQKRGRGDIVNISSLAASTGSFEGGAYAASKAGVNLLTLSLALELASMNIRVNAIAPGRITTPFRKTTTGPYYEFMLQQTPQKRMGTPEEVANTVAFVASRVSGFITGEILYITGGLHSVYLEHVNRNPDKGREAT